MTVSHLQNEIERIILDYNLEAEVTIIVENKDENMRILKIGKR